MESITVLIKTVLVKLMEREDFVDGLQLAFALLLGAFCLRVSLMLLNAEAFLKDASVYFLLALSGAAVIVLAHRLLGKEPKTFLLWYFMIAFAAAGLGLGYKFLTGTLTPILQ